MRAFVGSEGSTGAVKGVSKAIFAKLRLESGTSSRSAEVITVLIVLLEVSIGWLASDRISSRLQGFESRFALSICFAGTVNRNFLLAQGNIRTGNAPSARVLNGDQ